VNQNELLYAESHEWSRLEESDGKIVVIGISAFAVEQLTDIVFVELPEVGKVVGVGEEFGEVESVKAVSSLYSPVAGEVVEVNSNLADQPEALNDDPYDAGWIAKVRLADGATLDHLMDADAYQKQCADEA
jgi:glycine cleavage system H protein